MDLSHRGWRLAPPLVRPIEVFQHLGGDLANGYVAERHLDVVVVPTLVLGDRSRRAVLSLQLTQPLGHQVVNRRVRSDVTASLELEDQLGPRQLGLPKGPPEVPGDFRVPSGQRVPTRRSP